ncbi:MAG: NAD-dependent aldehyde dehydrogenase [uncultured archaeon A07HN63]|nr:MAG: NAD-dependent aldehyde dehydrogenase [uncultured archaeon A07HN63]
MVSLLAMSVDNTSESPTERKSAIKQRHEQAASEVVPENRQLYIGGEWVASISEETFETTDPTTGETLAEVAAGQAEDIDRAVDAAWEAYDGVYSDYSTAQRQAMLSAMADAVEENKEAFARLESLDNGKPIKRPASI